MLNNYEYNKLVDILSDVVTARTLMDCDCQTGLLRRYTDEMHAMGFIGTQVRDALTNEYAELDKELGNVYKKLNDAIEKCYEVVRGQEAKANEEVR